MKYGLLGAKLGHSWSPAIHELFGGTDFELCQVPPEELDAFLKKHDFLCINVTRPYKKDVIPYMATLSDEARRLGSVNLIAADAQGELHGFNTDYAGFLYMVRRAGIDVGGKKVLIFGDGGVSLTVRTAISDLGAAEIYIVSRRAGDVPEIVSGQFKRISYAAAYAEHTDADIIVNATPVGMYPDVDGCPVDISRFPSLQGVLDVIYNPVCTKLVEAAQEKGIPGSGGLAMVVAQAAAAGPYFFGREIPDEEIEKVYEQLKARM